MATGQGGFGWLDWAVVVAYFVGITLTDCGLPARRTRAARTFWAIGNCPGGSW